MPCVFLNKSTKSNTFRYKKRRFGIHLSSRDLMAQKYNLYVTLRPSTMIMFSISLYGSQFDSGVQKVKYCVFQIKSRDDNNEQKSRFQFVFICRILIQYNPAESYFRL